MSSIKSLALACVLLLPGSGLAHAFLRPSYEDATVVERSELIVVAHLKEGSIEYVPDNSEGSGWVHHARLVIAQVLKGECTDKEIPIIIHYGLLPVVGGHVQRDRFMHDLRRGQANYPKDIVEIIDDGNSSIGRPPLVKDARDDNLWFLRKRSGMYGREPGTGNFGIADPEDLQPLASRDYFLLYRSDNPEEAVRKYAAENPDVRDRAKRFLDHLEVQRILKVKDPKERFAKLLPFFLNRTVWNMKSEARQGIISSGDVAGEGLKRVFEDPKHSQLRQQIILMWRDMKYREIVPYLAELLQKHDQFWAKQELEKGWWNDDDSSERTRRRRDIYGEVYYGVGALRSIRDSRAREVLELTANRWKAIGFDNSQIVEECEAALRELPATDRNVQPGAPADADKPRC